MLNIVTEKLAIHLEWECSCGYLNFKEFQLNASEDCERIECGSCKRCFDYLVERSIE